MTYTDRANDQNGELEAERREALLIALRKKEAMGYTETNRIFRENLEIVDHGLVKATIGFLIANRIPGNPFWGFLVGGSGAGKALLPDHEVLTDKGWKFIKDIQKGDVVMAWDQYVEHSDGQLKYATVQGVYEQDHDGPIYVSKDSRPFFKASPDHRWLVQWSKKQKPRLNRWKVVRSTDLSSGMTIPASGNELLLNKQDYSDEEMELIGWYIAEGCRSGANYSRFSQFKKIGRNRIIKLLTELNIQHTESYGEIRAKWTPPFECGDNCYEKFIPRQLFFQKNRAKLLDGLIGGDGSWVNKGWEYYTASDQLRDDVQELAIGLGWRVNYYLKKVNYKYRSNNTIKNGKGMPLKYAAKNWRISGYKYKQIHLGKIEQEYYKGKTYCLWVPGPGTFIARYNGTPFVTGNTVMLDAMEAVQFTYPLSSLTPQTFISGAKNYKGLLYELSNKVLLFKDWTTILDMAPEPRAAIYAQLREIYDGSMTKKFGTGENGDTWRGKVGLLAGVTSIIDIREAQFSALGERFVKYRIKEPNSKTLARKALRNSGKLEDIRLTLMEAMTRCIKGADEQIQNIQNLQLSEEEENTLIDLADFATLARSPVIREMGPKKEMIFVPNREMPTRFTQQLAQMAMGLKAINLADGKPDQLLEEDHKILYQLALDSVPSLKRIVLQELGIKGSASSAEIATALDMPTDTIRRALEDVNAHKIVERSKTGREDTWTIKPNFQEILVKYDEVKIEMDSVASLLDEAEELRKAEEEAMKNAGIND